MHKKTTILPAIAVALMALGSVAGPASAQDPGPDPNESGVTETADLPEAPEAPEVPEAAADEEDTGDAESADVEDDEASAQPGVAPSGQASNDVASHGAATQAESVEANRRETVPYGGAAAGGGGMAPGDATSSVPFLLAGGMGLALVAGGLAARRRESLTAQPVRDRV